MKDDHGFDVPDVATAKGLVKKDQKARGDGSKDHAKANPDSDVSEHVRNDNARPIPVPKGRWLDDAWVDE